MSNTGHKHVYARSASSIERFGGKPFVVIMSIKARNYHVGQFATIHEACAAAGGFNKALSFFGLPWRFVRKPRRPTQPPL